MSQEIKIPQDLQLLIKRLSAKTQATDLTYVELKEITNTTILTLLNRISELETELEKLKKKDDEENNSQS